MRTNGLSRAGAMRALAAFLAQNDPDILALSEIDAGDALAVATRFNRHWAYRGGQALLWTGRFVAGAIHDLHLPVSPLRPFERRGLLRIDGRSDGLPLSLFATQFSSDRARVRELRFARVAVRATSGAALLFLAAPHERIGFNDLGFQALDRTDRVDGTIAARGYSIHERARNDLDFGIGATVFVGATRVTG